MYVKLPLTGGTTKTYTKVYNLTYSPEVDLTLSELRVDEFSVDVQTGDDIALDDVAELYDALDQLWAKYYVKDTKRVSDGMTRVTAQSAVGMMDRWKLGGQMFTNVTVAGFVSALFNTTPSSGYAYNLPYTIDSGIADKTVTGFCPEQTARERLQWLCIAAGCMVVTAFKTLMNIVPLPITEEPDPTLIPLNQTFARPDIEHKPRVASLRVTGYDSFTQTEPGEEDERDWKNGEDYLGHKWYFLPSELTFENEAMAEIPGSEPSITDVTLLGADDILDTLSSIAPAYFARDEVTVDVINNRQYKPGDRVTVYVTRDKLVTGYITSCAFKFGKQARSTLTLLGAESVIVSGLTIRYTWGDLQIGREDYCLPVGYEYSITARYISMEINGHKYVFRPTTTTITGTIEVGENEVTVICTPALDYHDEQLDVLGVDDINTQTETIGGASTIVGVIE